MADSSAEDIEFVGAWCAPVVSLADPDLTPEIGSPPHAYLSSDASATFDGVGAWCASVDVTDVTIVATPVEREIVDVEDLRCGYAVEICCVQCDTAWQDHWDEYMEFITPPPVWPSSTELLSEPTLAFLRSAELPGPAPDVFSLAYEVESSAIEHGGLLFYDMEPPEDEFSLENAQTLLQFFHFKQNDWMQHALMLWCLWVDTFLWDVVTYLIIGNGMRPKAHAGSRTSYRRLIKHERGHLRRSGFVPPLLRFLPLGWMILSSTIQVPHDWYPGVGLVSLPGPTMQLTTYWTRHFLDNTSDKVQRLDEMVILNPETLIQYNQRN